MNLSTKRGICISLIIHGSVLLFLMIYTWVEGFFESEPPPHVFTLSAPPVGALPVEGPVGRKIEKQPEVEKVKPREVKEEAEKPVVKKVEAKKEVVKPKKEEPAKVKAEPKEAKILKKTEGKKKVEENKVMSYEDFVKQVGVKGPKKKEVTAKNVVVPRIDTSDLKMALKESFSGVTQQLGRIGQPNGSEVLMDELTRYKVQVRDFIDGVWQEPLDFEGYRGPAVVQFGVGADGKLGFVKVVRSSGSVHFDESILKAFGKVSYVGVPPVKKGMVCEISFVKRGE